MADKGALTVVIDNGAASIKAGLSGDERPKVTFPCLVGRPRSQMPGLIEKDHLVGNEAQAKRGILTLKRPIENGVITNWDDMEKIWHHTFYNELRVAPEEHPVLLTEAPLNPTANREKITEMMFETFKTPSMSLASQAVLALYASGRVDGVVLDSGHSVTHAVPIHAGYTIHEAITRLNYAGQELTNLLMKMIIESGELATAGGTFNDLQKIKEETCYLALDFAEEQSKAGALEEKSFELPSGESFKVKEERFRCPEALFRPSLLGLDALGIHQAIQCSISNCNEALRASLYGAVVLAGGSTLFEGTQQRVTKELAALAPAGSNINVLAPETRISSAWIGGSILASVDGFKDVTITRKAYEETGPSIVHTVCSGRPKE